MPTTKRAGTLAKVVECLPDKHKALNSNTSATKKEKVYRNPSENCLKNY
jgi:hypothetical protein